MKTNLTKNTIIITSLLFAAILFYSCTDEKGAKKTLERSGYKPIKVGGYGWFAGSKEDVYRTEFTAIAPNGEIVTGCVTKGFFKGSTVRLDD
jgi:hypothetical protein